MKIISNFRHLVAGLTSLTLLLTSGATGRANVYATNVRLNGSANDAALYIPCGEVTISYLLNEAATAGVTIDILQGETVVHSLAFAGGSAEAERGAHAVIWDAHNSLGELVPLATYAVRITVAATGYSEWTQISEDFNPGNYAWDPTSIAVNKNTNSPYYGRVFLANASSGPNPGFSPGDRVGLLKLNADGSRASDGAQSSGGWTWSGDGFSPWKLEVSADDQLYVHDWTSNVVLRFDQQVTYDSRLEVLRADNRPAGSSANFTGLSVTGSGTDTWLSMADVSAPDGLGIRRWHIGMDGRLAANDLGETIVQAGTNSDLSVAPYDVALDASNRIYAVQYREAVGDAARRVLCFPPYSNGTPALTNAEWKIGSANNFMRGASGVAVDREGRYVAVAFAGSLVNGFLTGGRSMVLDAATGNTVTNIVTDLPGGESHDHLDVAWDNVGNLYDVDNYEGLWRVYSPPGSNAAVTVALAPLRVTEPPLAPILQAVDRVGSEFRFTLTGRTNVNYVIQASTDFTDWIAVATNGPAVCSTRLITVNATAERSFYRATPASTQ